MGARGLASLVGLAVLVATLLIRQPPRSIGQAGWISKPDYPHPGPREVVRGRSVALAREVMEKDFFLWHEATGAMCTEETCDRPAARALIKEKPAYTLGPREALQIFAEAYRLGLSQDELEEYAAHAALAVEKFAAARNHAIRAMYLPNSDKSRMVCVLAMAEANLGNAEQARRLLEKRLLEESGDLRSRVVLVTLYSQVGDEATADRHREVLKQLAPGLIERMETQKRSN